MSRLLESGQNEKLKLIKPAALPPELSKGDDPIADLLNEFQDYELDDVDPITLVVAPPTVALNQRDDQMWMTLGNQLGSLREGLQRLNFYLSDVDESVRR